MEPTATTYEELRRAFDFFNDKLFDGSLPPCLLTLQREKRTYGYFSAGRFGTRRGDTTDEIALNPEYFAVVPVIETLQTIAHEMVHLWQAHHGTPGRVRYHNAEWAAKMESIGLMPSHTGEPGGRRVGDVMADYIIPGGPFAKAVDELVGQHSFGITWFDRFTPEKPLHPVATSAAVGPITASALAIPASEGVQIVPRVHPATAVNRSNRDKYSCPGCRVNAWGKPALRLACLQCGLQLVPETPESRELAPADAVGRAKPRSPLSRPRSRP